MAAFCGHLVEACWLAAVIGIPLLYDRHALHGFDPIKLALLRALGLIVAGALVVRIAESAQKKRTFTGLPSWARAGTALLLAFLLASALSLDPAHSFGGSRQMLQGTFTLFCSLALFAGVATHLRSKEQWDRLVAAALAASVPIALYALLQRAGLDPIGYGGLIVLSFAGHPIYLAGYLLMLMPLCVWRLWRSLETPTAPRRTGETVFFALLLLLQFSAFVVTEKRGPFVALVASGACGLILLATYRQRFRLAAWGLAITLAVALLLLALAALGKTGLIAPEAPLLGRLSKIVPLGAGTGDGFRSSLWAAAPPLVTAAEPFVFPDGTPDRWRMLRPFAGYGPETLQGVIPQTWSMVGAGPFVRLEDRFHNGFWDIWYAAGLIGLAAFLWFFLSVYSASCRTLGLLGPRNGELRLGATALATALAAGGLMALGYGAGFFGLGFFLGFALGLVGWTFWKAGRDSAGSGPPENAAFLILALLVALLGHWVDLAFAFQTGETLPLFWIFSGMVAASGAIPLPGTSAIVSAGDQTAERKKGISTGLLAGIASGIMLIALLNAFINARSPVPLTTWDVLRGSLIRIRFDQGASFLIPLLLMPSWIGGIFFLMSRTRIGGKRELLKAFGLAGVLSLALGAAFAVLKAWWIASLGPLPSDAGTALAQAARLEVPGSVLLGLCLLGAVAMAGILLSADGNFEPSKTPVRIAAGLAGLSACLAIWFGAIRIPRLEAWDGRAKLLHQLGKKPLAAEVYLRALGEDPADIPSRIQCATILMEIAEQNAGTREFSAKMKMAEAVLLEGLERTKLNSANYPLGRLYLRWALQEPDEAAKKVLAERAREAFRRALRFSPKTEAEWVDASLVDLLLFDDAKSAGEKLKTADALTGAFGDAPLKVIPADWGDFYAHQAFFNRAGPLKKFYALRGIAYLDRAIEEEQLAAEKQDRSAPATDLARQNFYLALVTKAKLQRMLGEYPAALATLEKAAATPSAAGTWEAEVLLAQCYAEINDHAAASRLMAKALEGAPPAVRPQLLQIQRELAAKQTSPPQ